ncbi:MAG: hypothetical protein K0B15_04540 [Lentimicrobium sp.]|nr:hypothetical protein [Lentimicrobium sp.]
MNPFKALYLSCAIILIAGMLNLPIGYYTFMRIAVTIGAGVFIFRELKEEFTLWVILFGIIAIVFNPVFPVYLHSRSAWRVIDLLAAIPFLLKAFNSSAVNPKSE